MKTWNGRPEASALTKRMPEILRNKDPSLQNCLTLLRAVWQNQHDQVYQILRRLPWPEALQPLVQRYESMDLFLPAIFRSSTDIGSIGFFQDKSLVALSHSYEAIRPATAAGYLGLDQKAAENGDPNIITKFTGCGWIWDPETQLLHPKPIAVPSPHNQTTNGIREAMAMLGNRAG